MPIVATDPMIGLIHELQDIFASVPSLPASALSVAHVSLSKRPETSPSRDNLGNDRREKEPLWNYP